MCSWCKRAGHSAKSCTTKMAEQKRKGAANGCEAPGVVASPTVCQDEHMRAVQPNVRGNPSPPAFVTRSGPPSSPPAKFVSDFGEAASRLDEPTAQPPRKRGSNEDMVIHNLIKGRQRPIGTPNDARQVPRDEVVSRWASFVKVEMLGHWVRDLQQGAALLSLNHVENGSLGIRCLLCDFQSSVQRSLEATKNQATLHVLSEEHQRKLSGGPRWAAGQ